MVLWLSGIAQTQSMRITGCGGLSDCGRNRRSRRLLLTTNTELNAIAAPASIGLSNPAAARGRAAPL